MRELINYIRKRISEFFCGLMIFAVLLFAFIGKSITPYDSGKDECNSLESEIEWFLYTEEGVGEKVISPYQPGTDKDESSIIVGKLPENLENNMILNIRADQIDLRIWIDGKHRLTYDTAEKRYFGTVSPRKYIFLDLEKEDSGKEIKVEITTRIAATGKFEDVSYGTKYDVVYSWIQANMRDAVIAFVMIIFCTICFIAGVFVSINAGKFIPIVHLAVMGILASIWILCNAEISQIYFTNNSMSISIDYMMLMLLPFPFLFFMDSVQGEKFHRIYRIFECIVIVEIVVFMSLAITNTLDLSQLFFGIAGVFGASLIMILITMGIDIIKNKNRNYRIIAIGIFAAIVATIIQIVLFIAGVISFGGCAVAYALLILLATTIVDTVINVKKMQMEKQIAIAEGKAQSDFLANMSHEIRTPINAVLGMNEMILREAKDSQILEYSENIDNSGKMLLSIVNDILDFSKIKSGKLEIIEDKYSLCEMIKEIEFMLRPKAETKNLAFEIAIDEEMPNYLTGDVVRIKQVVVNLLNNAVKYTEKGRVLLKVSHQKKDENNLLLRMDIIDSGKGIKEEDIGNLFDAFSRADEKNNRNIEGTGLGLALVQNLVNAMHGEVSVTSEYGKGSVFSVEIPQIISGEVTVGQELKVVKNTKAEKPVSAELFTAPEAEVLVVDDTKVNLMVAKGLLKRTKVKVTLVSSGQECIEAMKNNRFDVVLLDHLMPVMDGEETLKEIKNERLSEGTAIVALTANAIGGARERYLSMGFDDYISKPIQPEELEGVLLKFIPEEKIVK